MSEREQDCTHTDGYGSTIIFVQSRPQDGVCLLCDATFPALRVLPATESRKPTTVSMPGLDQALRDIRGCDE